MVRFQKSVRFLGVLVFFFVGISCECFSAGYDDDDSQGLPGTPLSEASSITALLPTDGLRLVVAGMIDGIEQAISANSTMSPLPTTVEFGSLGSPLAHDDGNMISLHQENLTLKGKLLEARDVMSQVMVWLNQNEANLLALRNAILKDSEKKAAQKLKIATLESQAKELQAQIDEITREATELDDE